jgi:hypothetical protein
MSEHGDEVFQSDSRQGEHPAPALSHDTPSQPNQPKQDLVDTFDLFKTYLDHKLHDLKSDIISEQENLSLKVKGAREARKETLTLELNANVS